MPLWGWIVLILAVSAVMLPIKLKLLKKMTQKKKRTFEEEE
ncbi:MAG: hypothetical protein K0R84_233 [Clostridia bacterium]|nr:hypothetical protein [Clostridia bacterium]